MYDFHFPRDESGRELFVEYESYTRISNRRRRRLRRGPKADLSRVVAVLPLLIAGVAQWLFHLATR